MLVYLEDAQKKKYLIDEDSFNIGRDGSRCQLKLPNNRLFSALQATIVVQDDMPLIEKYILVDRSSNHNTYVNGKAVDKKVLKHGDRISFSEEQKFFVTFKLNTSAPTLVPSNEGYIKPQLEASEPNDLLSTIKETKNTNVAGDVQQIGDKEIEDLRNFMQRSMMERNEKPKNFAETNDEISIPPEGETSETHEELTVEKKVISRVGEETEIDFEAEKLKKLQETYNKTIAKQTLRKPKTTKTPLVKELISVSDGTRFSIAPGVTICGSSPKANICLANDSGVAPQNFKLIHGEDSVVINPLDNENVIVNGAILRESRKLEPKDIIRVGKQIFYFVSGHTKYRNVLTNSVVQTKERIRNFYTLQNAANDIDLGTFHLKISTKFSEKENLLYCIAKNQQSVFIFIGDLISTNIGFALVVQELRGAFSALVEITNDLNVIARGFDTILKKYAKFSCEGNVSLVGKGLLLQFSEEKLSWLNCGSYLPPILIDSEKNRFQNLEGATTSLLGHLFAEKMPTISSCSFKSGCALLIQPDCIPAKNHPKIMLKLKDVNDLFVKMQQPPVDVAVQRLLSSNVTSLIAIERKIAEVTCPHCGRVFPSEYVFCPYDSTKLV